MGIIYAVVCDDIEQWIIHDALKGLYEVECFLDYRLFLDKMKVKKPDLIIIDTNIELIQGEQLLIHLKNHRMYCELPVIVINRVFNDSDYARMLELGADDYLTKPFKTAELVFKIKKILRKNIFYNVKVGDIFINQRERIVYVNNESVVLTFKEFQLLTYLCNRNGRIITRKELENNIWKNYINDSRTLDMHIATLRNKVFSKSLCQLDTIIKIGYRLNQFRKK